MLQGPGTDLRPENAGGWEMVKHRARVGALVPPITVKWGPCSPSSKLLLLHGLPKLGIFQNWVSSSFVHIHIWASGLLPTFLTQHLLTLSQVLTSRKDSPMSSPSPELIARTKTWHLSLLDNSTWICLSDTNLSNGSPKFCSKTPQPKLPASLSS